MPTPDREPLLEALRTMPEEAYSWVALAMLPRAMMLGAFGQIWMDGIGGFQAASALSIEAARKAAADYVAALRQPLT